MTVYNSPLPYEILEMIICEAWLDQSCPDRLALYRVFTLTRDARCLNLLLDIAWKWVICFTAQEFRLYLRLRFGSKLKDKERRSRPHAAVLLTQGVMFRDMNEFRNKRAMDDAKVLQDMILEDMQTMGVLDDDPFFRLGTSPIYLFLRVRRDDGKFLLLQRLSVGSNLGEWLDSLKPEPSNITVVDEILDGFRGGLTLPSVVNLAVSSPAGRMSWGASSAFSEHLPCLRTLTLTGAPVRIQPMLPHLPDSLQHLKLVVHFHLSNALEEPCGDTTPHGNLHLWYIIPALRQGLKVGGQTSPAPQLTLCTGLEQPVGWTTAVRAAGEAGVRLIREIDTASARRARWWI